MGDDERDLDGAAWVRAVIDRWQGPLIRYAARVVGDEDRARDVVQDAFLRLCREPRADVERRLPEWLFTVCRNRAIDVARKEGRMRATGDLALSGRPSTAPPPAALAEEAETKGRLLGLLDALPPNQQEVVRLKFQHGLSYKEIARVTELSVGNVGFLLHTAIKTLRARLEAPGRTA